MPSRKNHLKKVDLRKLWKPLYAPSAREVQTVKVPALKFLMLDGALQTGQTPEASPDFQQAFGALYGVTYKLKFMSKLRARNPIDYNLMPVEGLWWLDSGEFEFGSPAPWNWTLMIMQPGHITEVMFRAAVQQMQEKRDDPALSRLRFESFREGLCVQVLHIGPYAQEAHTIERLKVYARDNGYALRGKHHEIYLGDPRLVKPDKLRTILRLPVERAV